MSAKKARKPAPAATPSPVPATAPAMTEAAPPAWIDSDDPKKRQWAKIILAVVWLYVAALWLLALDQWFHWGIFGPKVPPTP
jgi:hypothetical protein